MTKRPIRAGSVLFCAIAVMSVNGPTAGQVSAKQGQQNPNQFRGSMVLEAPFLPASPSSPRDLWFTSPKYAELRNYRCDGIGVPNIEFRIDKPTKSGQLPILIKVWLHSQPDTHDKMVDVKLEVHNGDQVVAATDISVKVEDGYLVKRQVKLLISPLDMSADPITELRISVWTKDV